MRYFQTQRNFCPSRSGERFKNSDICLPLHSCKLTQRMFADCVKFVVCLLLLPSVVECCRGRRRKVKEISKYAYYLFILVCDL